MEIEDFELQESTNLGLKHVVRRHVDDDIIFLVMQVLLILLQGIRIWMCPLKIAFVQCKGANVSEAIPHIQLPYVEYDRVRPHNSQFSLVC
jgi:hypothetical protein